MAGAIRKIDTQGDDALLVLAFAGVMVILLAAGAYFYFSPSLQSLMGVGASSGASADIVYVMESGAVEVRLLAAVNLTQIAFFGPSGSLARTVDGERAVFFSPTAEVGDAITIEPESVNGTRISAIGWTTNETQVSLSSYSWGNQTMTPRAGTATPS